MERREAHDAPPQHRYADRRDGRAGGRHGGFDPQASEGLIEQHGPHAVALDTASGGGPPRALEPAAGARQDVLVPTNSAPQPVASADLRYQRVRGYFAQDFSARQTDEPDSADGERTFAQAEPNYRVGFDAGGDLRYAGQTFEEIEPELRHEYETRDRGSGGPATTAQEAPWERLREEIRVGFRRARSDNQQR